MSRVGFNIPEGKSFVFAVVAASAATVGRLVLATFARALVRARLMRDSDRQNIEVVEDWLKERKKLTVCALFLYALGPFLSNYLFIARGFSGLPLGVTGAAFFAGRTISYSVWANLGRLAPAYVDLAFPVEGEYLSGYFIVLPLALPGTVTLVINWAVKPFTTVFFP